MIVVNQTCGKLVRRTSFQTGVLLSKFRKRWFESSNGDRGDPQSLTQTTIFIQEGTNIQEVPLIVRKVSNIETVYDDKGKEVSSVDFYPRCSRLSKKEQARTKSANIVKEMIGPRSFADKKGTKSILSKRRIDIETEEGTAILYCSDLECLNDLDIEEILSGMTPTVGTKATYSSLESKIADEINCRVALQGLRKVIEIENTRHRYRHGKTSKMGGHVTAEAASRDTVMKQLVKMIAKSQDTQIIVEGLSILKKDKFNPARNAHRDRLCEEALIRATDGEFSLLQLIDVMKILAGYKDAKYRDAIDALWAGIASRDEDINEESLVPLFRSLHYFDRSKNMVKMILERKLSDHWLRLTGSQVAEILNSLFGKVSSLTCLVYASKWASVSVSTSKEKDLVNFIQSLCSKDYIDERIEEALEEYMKVKGSNIKDPCLIVALLNYCETLRVRNSHILSGCGEYFIKRGKDLPSSLLAPVLTAFGSLNTQPPNTAIFWRTFEEVLLEKFSELKLNDILDILLSCVYLEKYPINFSERIFKSHSVDKIYAKKISPYTTILKNKLVLLDTAMSLECEDYRVPRINADRTGRSLLVDSRIRRVINLISRPLAGLIGGEQKLSKSVVLSHLPLVDFYVLDILIHPFCVSMPVLNLDLKEKRNINTVILIYLPEHYCRNTKQLIGLQAMRRRHIRKLGFRVTSLDYVTLKDLADQSEKLSEYLSKNLERVEDAL